MQEKRWVETESVAGFDRNRWPACSGIRTMVKKDKNRQIIDPLQEAKQPGSSGSINPVSDSNRNDRGQRQDIYNHGARWATNESFLPVEMIKTVTGLSLAKAEGFLMRVETTQSTDMSLSVAAAGYSRLDLKINKPGKILRKSNSGLSLLGRLA